jgi:uncharacterized protein (TIGR00255 family)
LVWIYTAIFTALIIKTFYAHMAETLRSMTGFGRAEKTGGTLAVLVEVKSLNGKQLDLNLKLPPLLKPYEFDVRNLVSEKVMRGSVECNITVKQNGSTRPAILNIELIKAYYQSLVQLNDELNLDTSQVLGALLKLPEVVLPVTEVVDDEGWQLVKDTLNEAIGNLNYHRGEEGRVLQGDLEQRIRHIENNQAEVAKLAPLRQVKVKENIQKKVEENLSKESYDKNRLEQEIIYYIEKMDISEELVRLRNHCDYFFAILQEDDIAKGKKLGFVLQEIGREINTTGAKAYDAEMQKFVVLMKDELEKAKEQVLNVL